MMDVSKLSAAPWTHERVNGLEDVTQGPVDDASDRYSVLEDPTEADAEFIALARNAFDVCMRWGWGVRVTSTGWNISGTLGMLPNDGGFNEWLCQREWPDPFSALVEADRWYAANVEGSK